MHATALHSPVLPIAPMRFPLFCAPAEPVKDPVLFPPFRVPAEPVKDHTPALTSLLAGLQYRARRPRSALGALRTARWTYVTRCVDRDDIIECDRRFDSIAAGDLLLARVISLGQHRVLHLADGRTEPCTVGEHIVVVAGNHRACEEFEGTADVPADGCDLLSPTGIVGTVRFADETVGEPTRLEPVARLLDADGCAINLDRYAIPPRTIPRDTVVIGVLGSGSRAETDKVAASLALGLADDGLDVAVVSATGCVSPEQRQTLRDAYITVLDTVEAGMASAYLASEQHVARALRTLVGTAAEDGAEVVIVEFGHPLTHLETATLLDVPEIRECLDATVFAAADAAGAHGGVRVLRERGLRPLAVSGRLARSPHAAVETENALSLPVCSHVELRDGSIARGLAGPVLETARVAA